MTTASLMGIATLLLGVPLVLMLLFASPSLHRFLLGLLAFTTCHVKKPFYMEIFFEAYRGVDRGFGVTLSDLLFLGFFLYILMGGSKARIIWWPVNTSLWIVLIGICFLSLTASKVPYYGLFTIHKFIRGYILFWVTVNLVRTRADVFAVIMGLMAAVLFQTGVVLWDKYITHSVVNRSVGSFPHPNTLSMYVDLIIPTLLALLLAKGFSKRQNTWAGAAILGGILCVIFSKSRASLVIVIGALGSVTALSILMKPTARKVIIVLLGFVLLDIVGALAAPKIIARFQKAPEASEQTRVYFNIAARAMADANTFGMGINTYAWALANTDYYWFVYPDALEEQEDLEAFRESKQGQSRLGTAHHIYYLFAAETGWPGMLAFILFLVRYYLHNLFCLLRARDEALQAVLLGTLVGFSTLHLQGLLEWIFRQTQVFFLFSLMSGLMVATGNLAGRNTRHG